MNFTQNTIKLEIENKTKQPPSNSRKYYEASDLPPLTESLGLILQFCLQWSQQLFSQSFPGLNNKF